LQVFVFGHDLARDDGAFGTIMRHPAKARNTAAGRVDAAAAAGL